MICVVTFEVTDWTEHRNVGNVWLRVEKCLRNFRPENESFTLLVYWNLTHTDRMRPMTVNKLNF